MKSLIEDSYKSLNRLVSSYRSCCNSGYWMNASISSEPALPWLCEILLSANGGIEWLLYSLLSLWNLEDYSSWLYSSLHEAEWSFKGFMNVCSSSFDVENSWPLEFLLSPFSFSRSSFYISSSFLVSDNSKFFSSVLSLFAYLPKPWACVSVSQLLMSNETL